MLLFCYVGSKSSMHNLATVASQGASHVFFFTKVTSYPMSGKKKCFNFFWVSTESCFTYRFPCFRVGQIKQMTLVFFPCSLHTLLISCCPSTVEWKCRHFGDFSLIHSIGESLLTSLFTFLLISIRLTK